MTSAFEEQNAASTFALLCLEQRWADEPNTELLRKDRHVNVTPRAINRSTTMRSGELEGLPQA
jgi:hypothetical protein